MGEVEWVITTNVIRRPDLDVSKVLSRLAASGLVPSLTTHDLLASRGDAAMPVGGMLACQQDAGMQAGGPEGCLASQAAPQAAPPQGHPTAQLPGLPGLHLVTQAFVVGARVLDGCNAREECTVSALV